MERAKYIKKFVNLTTGLEFLVPFVQNWEARVELGQFINYTRIQSTMLERGKLAETIANLDDNLLFNLAVGNKCIIYDRGSRSADGVSRVVWHGIPWIKYVLERAWFGATPDTVMVRKHNLAKYFNKKYKELKRPVRRKIEYYKKFIGEGQQDVSLQGVSVPSNHDGDDNYYTTLVDLLYAKPPVVTGGVRYGIVEES